MHICQCWAQINRKLIVNLIMDFIVGKGVVSSEEHFRPFESVHNYIGNDNIIRKGVISARLGEKCIIPLNMRDGSLICIGKGNEDWSFSAPHGTGNHSIFRHDNFIGCFSADKIKMSARK